MLAHTTPSSIGREIRQNHGFARVSASVGLSEIRKF